MILVYLAWMSIPLCLAFGRKREHETPANGRSWLGLLLLLAIVQIVMVQFVYGVRITRVYPIFPAAMVGLAASFSFLSPRGRRCLAPVVGAIVVLQAALVAGYLHLGYREWQDRDPERFAPVVAEIVAHGDAKVACVPQFWYAFHRRAMFPTILDFGVLFDRDAWMRHPDRIQRYDAVCLPANHEFLSVMDASRYQRRSVESCGERYYIFEARPSDSPRAR